MDKTVREILINKIGQLHVANAELAAEHTMLAKRCQEQAMQIRELQQKLAQPSLPIGDLPANPYELPSNGAAH